jgi:hypothetical protein
LGKRDGPVRSTRRLDQLLPVLKTEIEEAAEANGISERTLFNAERDLGIEARKDGDGGN